MCSTNKARAGSCQARRLAEDANERLAKAAGGLESAADSRLGDAAAVADFVQGETHAPGVMVRLESHAVVALELAPRCRGIDIECCEFLFGDTSTWSSLDLSSQTFD